jgi:hypothetical protein
MAHRTVTPSKALAARAVLGLALVLVASGWAAHAAPFGADAGATGTVAAPAAAPPGGGTAGPHPPTIEMLLAAGDIASCSGIAGAEATARLLAAKPGTIAALGDLAYPDGRSSDFGCFDRTWGRFKDRLRPTPGNHEYHTAGAAGYFDYFGSRAGERGKGWYSYDLGGWHVVVINSNCDEVDGGCLAGSPQERWLRRDLEVHRGACLLAYWHHPLFSSGAEPEHAERSAMRAIWRDLFEAGADVVLNGHEHSYERFAPQDPEGRADPRRGIREFVVGTGGKDFTLLPRPRPNSEIRGAGTFGILELALAPDGYDWKFVPIAGGTFSDAGHGSCHRLGRTAAPARTGAQP